MFRMVEAYTALRCVGVLSTTPCVYVEVCGTTEHYTLQAALEAAPQANFDDYVAAYRNSNLCHDHP